MTIGRYLPKPIIVLFLVVVITACATAQIKFTTVTSGSQIGRGDYLQVEFIIENAKEIDNLVPPSFPNFKIVEGPIQSSGMSIVNGNTSQYKGVSFVLQPVKTGSFTISGATATVDGKSMHSNPVTVEVNATASANATSPITLQPVWPDDPVDASQEYILRPGENIAEKIKKNLFVRAQADKTTCFLGEPIVVTYKLYSRLRSESRVTRRPSLNGFSVYDMTDPNADIASVETLNGKQFAVHIIRKAQLIPLQPGTIELDPAEVENKVYFIKQSGGTHRHHSLLDQIFGQSDGEGAETSEDITLESQPLAINIKPLPELNKPANFNGAVGKFSIEAALDNKKIAARDAGTLKVVVKGNGNLPIVNAPQVNWPDSIEAYDPTAKENVDKTVYPLGGSKTFSYAFTPREKGNYTLAPIGFSYFDPSSATYKTIRTSAVDINVTATSKQKKFLETAREETDNLLKAFILDHLEWFFAILILSGLAIYLWRQNTRLRKTEAESKPVTSKTEGQPEHDIATLVPVQTDPLLRAKRLLANNDPAGFYRELNQATWDLLRDRLHVPSSELNKQHIRDLLKEKGFDDTKIALLEKTLNACEINLYTPDQGERNMQQTLLQAELLTKYIDEGLGGSNLAQPERI